MVMILMNYLSDWLQSCINSLSRTKYAIFPASLAALNFRIRGSLLIITASVMSSFIKTNMLFFPCFFYDLIRLFSIMNFTIYYSWAYTILWALSMSTSIFNLDFIAADIVALIFSHNSLLHSGIPFTQMLFLWLFLWPPSGVGKHWYSVCN